MVVSIGGFSPFPFAATCRNRRGCGQLRP
jgi:hypothetical protein